MVDVRIVFVTSTNLEEEMIEILFAIYLLQLTRLVFFEETSELPHGTLIVGLIFVLGSLIIAIRGIL